MTRTPDRNPHRMVAMGADDDLASMHMATAPSFKGTNATLEQKHTILHNGNSGKTPLNIDNLLSYGYVQECDLQHGKLGGSRDVRVTSAQIQTGGFTTRRNSLWWLLHFPITIQFHAFLKFIWICPRTGGGQSFYPRVKIVEGPSAPELSEKKPRLKKLLSTT